MIVETIADLRVYSGLGARFAVAVDWLDKLGKQQFTPGARYDIAEGIYANCMEYETKDSASALYESHQKYIDIQCLLSGREFVEVAEARLLTVSQAYDGEKDIAFYGNAEGHRVRLVPGLAAVFFPRDAHKPCVAVAPGERVKKIVVKVAV